jgi:hypothetical protein
MKIFTVIDKFTTDKLIKENKRRTESQIFPTGPIEVPVMFLDIPSKENAFFTVVDGKIAMRTSNKKIDFGLEFYTKNDGPEAITDMLATLNGFFHKITKVPLYNFRFEHSLFTCIDKILFDLGYVGKIVKAEGIEQDEKGERRIYSINYAENLITKDDWVYNEYAYIKESEQIH